MSSTSIIEANGDFVETPGSVVESGRTLQRVGNQFLTAVGVQRPRDLNAVKRRVLAEATLAGETMFYSWAVRNKDGTQGTVEGASIKLAMTIARNYGNCAAGCMEEVEDTGDAYIFTGTFIDLETGFSFVRKYRQSKSSVVHMKTDEERKADVRFQIGQSKAIRNAVIACAPEAIVIQAIAAAKKGVLDQIMKAIQSNGIAAVQDRAIAALVKLGASEESILARHGIVDRKALTPEHLVTMHGDIRTIQDGEERATSLYPPVDIDPNAASAKIKDAIKKPVVSQETPPAEVKEQAPAPEKKEPPKKAKAKETVKEPEPKEEEPAPESEPAETVTADGDVIEDAEPDWVEKRKNAYNSITNVDRMRLPISDLCTEWKKADADNKKWWEQLIFDASNHLLGLCVKISVVPMAKKLLKDALKGYDEQKLAVMSALFDERQQSFSTNAG